MLPSVGNAKSVIGICDGLLLSGGGDISPNLCGITDYNPALLSDVSPERDLYELELARLAYEKNIPTLAICRGLQVMNVALGGSLNFDISGHRQKRSRDCPSHSIDIKSGSLLRRLIQKSELEVNSFHHQSVNTCAESLKISAKAEDGTIEAIEAEDKKFYLGVQWHPEHMDSRECKVLFAALCAAANGFARA